MRYLNYFNFYHISQAFVNISSGLPFSEFAKLEATTPKVQVTGKFFSTNDTSKSFGQLFKGTRKDYFSHDDRNLFCRAQFRWHQNNNVWRNSWLVRLLRSQKLGWWNYCLFRCCGSIGIYFSGNIGSCYFVLRAQRWSIQASKLTSLIFLFLFNYCSG